LREAEFTRKLLRALRSHAALKDAVIYKISDRFSAGIPDFYVFVRAGHPVSKPHSSWWEIKVAPRQLTALQAHYINKLYPISYVISRVDARNHFISGDPMAFNFDELVESVVTRCIDA